MGLSDFLGAVVNATPIGREVASGVNWAAHKFVDQSQANMDQSRRNPRMGNVGAAANPVLHQVTVAANNPAGAPYRALGEQAEQYGQNKIEAAQGYYKLGKFVFTHNPRETMHRAGQIASTVKEHPEILGHAVVEAGVATALDPMTYVGGGLTGGAAITEGLAARAGRRAVTEVGEEAAGSLITHSADELAEATGSAVAREAAKAAREVAPAGAEDAAAAAARRASRPGRLLEALDQAPANLREAVTGNPVGRIGQARIDLGEKLLPGARGSIPGALLKDAIQSSPSLPTEGAGLLFRQAKWRAGQVGWRATMPSSVRTATRVGQIINDPMKALTSPAGQDLAIRGANWAIKEHPEAVAAVAGVAALSQAGGLYSTVKGVMGGFEDKGDDAGAAKKDEPYTPYQQTDNSVRSIGLQQFHLSNTRSTRVSRRQPGGTPQLGTVQSDTMPKQIGPSNWYGPQGGYDAGRGFQQRSVTPSGPLAPLEQPDRANDVLGV